MLELLEKQERLTVNQWKLISAAVLGGALGSLAFFLPGFALGAASVTRHLTYTHSPLIHQSTGVGTVLGAIFWGWMADRVGRRKAFIATALNVSLASGIMAVTPEQGGFDLPDGLFPFLCPWRFGPIGHTCAARAGIRTCGGARLGWRVGDSLDFVGDICIVSGITMGRQF
jgi:MFS family permease